MEEMLLTENGYYRLLYAPGGQLTQGAADWFRQAAKLGGELIYGDETVTGEGSGERKLHKPDWSPDTLRSFNYIGGPVAVREGLWNAAGCKGHDTPGERYANLLRMAPLTESILHISKVLFRGPAQSPPDPVRAVAGQLRSEGVKATVREGLLPGTAAVRYAIPRGGGISCAVYGSGGAEAFRRTLESVACRNTYLHVDFIVADGCRPDEETERYLYALKQKRAAAAVRLYGETNLARLCNLAVEKATGDAVLFLPAGYTLRSHDGLTRMLEYALLPHTGAVFGGVERPGEQPDANERIIRNVPHAQPPLMIRRDRFLSAGGFDETLGRTGFAEALCWRLRFRRLHNVATPYAAFQQPAHEQTPPITARNDQRYKDLLFQWEREQEVKKSKAFPEAARYIR